MEYLNNKDINNIPEEEWQSFTNNDQDNMKTTTREIKELDLLNRKILELNTEYKKQKLKAQNYYNQMISNEKLIKDLNSKEQDLQESINVKDSQIAALKVQMEQLLLELQEKDEKYNELQLLNEKINNELHERLDNNEMINNLHNEIDQLKQSLEFEKIESKRIQDSCNQQIIRLENNQRSLIDELDSYRRQLNEQKSNRLELEILNNNLRKKYENIEQEFEQFKISKNKDNDLDNRTETSTYYRYW
ncbi:Golgin sub A member 5 [Dermatophagoides pteronyssinus]|uniref:Golgin sub A member 5 n=1 Tax=Dermatophagoides pteronyssinus TaxID=6956 RepID=A0ABQ8J406_DERPT|nr:Golgin sub A member 5 [Dermatophagoides pteronyssinus]